MRILTCILLVLFCCTIQAQSYTISGYVEDAETGEKLLGANVFDALTFEGTTTNNFGFFSLSLPEGTKTINVSYIGYNTNEEELTLTSDLSLQILLQPANQLDEIEIIAERQKNVAEESAMSTIEVPVMQIKKIPALMGEVDVLKALQLLPGVQSGGEGQSGLYVRGGSPDQNLILLDGVPVYNVSHLFGFFSVFNADAIKEVKLIKGGYPARFSGRLSSILEINMKDGNMKEFGGSGSIGLISSKLTLEGPIKTDKTSFIVSARRTYLDLLIRPFVQKDFRNEGQTGGVGYYFYDLNAKVNHIFSKKDRLYFSIYGGNDKFYFNAKDADSGIKDFTENSAGWGNITSALRWNHLWTPKLFSNTSLTYSRYKLDFGIGFGTEYPDQEQKDEVSLDYNSGITDFSAKIDFDYYPNPNHFIKFGLSAINHSFIPGEFDLLFTSVDNTFAVDTTVGQEDIQSQEFDAYVEDDFLINDKIKANIGLHASGFLVQDEFYSSLQPRASLRYLLAENKSIKFSFATMRQYVNLITSENLGLPTDLWVPSTAKIKPQKSWQAAVGYAFKLSDQLDVTVEGYYKEMENVISFKEGEGFFDSTLRDWGDRVTQGRGKAYGAELFVQKKTGRLSGWIGYTLAWSKRQFDDLNFGNEFPFRYDRRHDVSVVVLYEFSDRVNFSSSWVYGTGNAVSLANSVYRTSSPNETSLFTYEVEHFTDKNNFRLRPYHRFDVGVNFEKQKKGHKRIWSFGVYNAYNRKNPYYLYIDTDTIVDDMGNISTEKTLKEQAIFPIIPYFNYSFTF